MAPSETELRAAVAAVEDPLLRRGLGELGMVRSVDAGRGGLWVTVAMPVDGWPAAAELVELVRAALGTLPGGADVGVETPTMSEDERAELHRRLALSPGGAPGPVVSAPPAHSHRPGGPPGPIGHEEGRPNRFMAPGSRTRVIGISSGKGGVGKSSVTVNLAVALAARGHDVGLLDADVYGFSAPKMLGVRRSPVAIDNLLVPPVVHGVRCLSMGFFVPDTQPVIWRGPMLHKTLEQFLVDAYWGEPDYLLIDMPPGTGDVALSLGQYLPRTEILVVTTPQPAAQRVAQRSAFGRARSSWRCGAWWRTCRGSPATRAPATRSSAPAAGRPSPTTWRCPCWGGSPSCRRCARGPTTASPSMSPIPVRRPPPPSTPWPCGWRSSARPASTGGSSPSADRGPRRARRYPVVGGLAVPDAMSRHPVRPAPASRDFIAGQLAALQSVHARPTSRWVASLRRAALAVALLAGVALVATVVVLIVHRPAPPPVPVTSGTVTGRMIISGIPVDGGLASGTVTLTADSGRQYSVRVPVDGAFRLRIPTGGYTAEGATSDIVDAKTGAQLRCFDLEPLHVRAGSDTSIIVTCTFPA